MHNPAHPFVSADRGRVASSWAILALVVLIAGCSSTSAAVPAATATPTATPVAIGGVSGSTTEDIGDGDSAQPEQAQVTSLAGGAACLPGTWFVDRASLASYIEEAMNVTSATSIEIEPGLGELLLTFDTDEGTSYQAQDLEFYVSVGGLADIRVVIQGEGIASYVADETLLATWDHLLVSEALGESSSTTTSAVLMLTPDQLFLQGKSTNLTLTITGAPSDSNLTLYACSGDILTLNPGDSRSTTWLRTH